MKSRSRRYLAIRRATRSTPISYLLTPIWKSPVFDLNPLAYRGSRSKTARSPAEHFTSVTFRMVSVAPMLPMIRARWFPMRTVRWRLCRHSATGPRSRRPGGAPPRSRSDSPQAAPPPGWAFQGDQLVRAHRVALGEPAHLGQGGLSIAHQRSGRPPGCGGTGPAGRTRPAPRPAGRRQSASGRRSRRRGPARSQTRRRGWRPAPGGTA